MYMASVLRGEFKGQLYGEFRIMKGAGPRAILVLNASFTFIIDNFYKLAICYGYIKPRLLTNDPITSKNI